MNRGSSFAGVGLILFVASVCVSGQSSDSILGGSQVETGRMVADKTAKGSVRGRVVLPGGHFVSQTLKVSLLTVNGLQAQAYTDNQGVFEFPELTPGNYEVQVETSGTEYQVVSQNVQVFRGMPSVITITMGNGSAASARPNAAAVSVGELGPDVPKAARKEFELATKAVRDNKTDVAIGHFRKAIDIYPKFVMARSDLGVQLLALGQLDEAADQLRQAVQIDQKAYNPKLNLGIVLVQQQMFAEAAQVLTSALALNSESPAAWLYAGLAHSGIGNLNEAEKDFKPAYTLGGSSYSLALFHLGQLYMSKGDRQSALKAFQSYLRDSPSAPNAVQVQKLIAMLR